MAGEAAERVAAAVEAVGSGGWEFRNAYRRQLLALSRRIRLLGPFAEELQEARWGTEAEAEEQERRDDSLLLQVLAGAAGSSGRQAPAMGALCLFCF